ncbi:MAG: hypothetical protein RLZZ290_1647, partial [Pseudomonadota bacterium]
MLLGVNKTIERQGMSRKHLVYVDGQEG